MHSRDFYTSNGSECWYGNGNFLFFIIPNNNLGMASAQATDGKLIIADLVLRKFRLFSSSNKSKIICVSQHFNSSDSGIEVWSIQHAVGAGEGGKYLRDFGVDIFLFCRLF